MLDLWKCGKRGVRRHHDQIGDRARGASSGERGQKGESKAGRIRRVAAVTILANVAWCRGYKYGGTGYDVVGVATKQAESAE